jgi:hypothetical protein
MNFLAVATHALLEGSELPQISTNTTNQMQNYIERTNGEINKCGPHEGKPLPHMESREVTRTFRSKYAPHFGKKQEAKATRRLLRKPENELALLA